MKLPSYSQYISQKEEDREILYLSYCKKNKLDPTIEYSVIEFFDALDKINTPEDTTDEHSRNDD